MINDKHDYNTKSKICNSYLNNNVYDFTNTPFFNQSSKLYEIHYYNNSDARILRGLLDF